MEYLWIFIAIGVIVGLGWFFLRSLDSSIQSKTEADMRLYESSPETFRKVKNSNIDIIATHVTVKPERTVTFSIDGVNQLIDTTSGVSESVISELAQKLGISKEEARNLLNLPEEVEQKFINGDLNIDTVKELNSKIVKINDVDEKFLKQDESLKNKSTQKIKDSFKERLKDI